MSASNAQLELEQNLSRPQVHENAAASTVNSNFAAPQTSLASSTAPVQAVNSNDMKIVDEFQYLLEKSQQLFAGLRDLPPIGAYKQWQPYFQKTFELYTKVLFSYFYSPLEIPAAISVNALYQIISLIARHVLENKEFYGLKRWEIGEIASKIGQLYYHYYLRTSETNYLFEAYVFYEAIRERAYFKEATETKNPALMIKKLRYYARYIVVCLLLNKITFVKKLTEELAYYVEEYSRVYKGHDAAEWQLVLEEINRFLDIQTRTYPHNFDGQMLPSFSRFKDAPTIPDTENISESSVNVPNLKLQEAVLVGNWSNQVKFSELTIDLFHFLQCLEREPQLDKSSFEAKNSTGVEEKKTVIKRSNPHKYLLYKPTLSQLLVYISTAFRELTDDSAALLYISADGIKPESNELRNSILDVFSGGIAMSSQSSLSASLAKKTNLADSGNLLNTSLSDCLHPGDLIPFTRKPLFLVIESSNSSAFKNFPQVFNQPLVCLLSPQKIPDTYAGQSLTNGNVFTLFLSDPLVALSYLLKQQEVGFDAWAQSKKSLQNLELIVYDLFHTSAGVDKNYKRFLQDDFTKRILTRFVLFHYIGQLVSVFSDHQFMPSSYPSLPAALFSDELVRKTMANLI